jgi:hypothetical protein
MYAFSSFTYLFAMLSSNYALEFVSYPMQVKKIIKISSDNLSSFLGFGKINKTCSGNAFGCTGSQKTISTREIHLCFINCSWYI